MVQDKDRFEWFVLTTKKTKRKNLTDLMLGLGSSVDQWLLNLWQCKEEKESAKGRKTGGNGINDIAERYRVEGVREN